jgi:hypothetical protein
MASRRIPRRALRTGETIGNGTSDPSQPIGSASDADLVIGDSEPDDIGDGDSGDPIATSDDAGNSGSIGDRFEPIDPTAAIGGSGGSNGRGESAGGRRKRGPNKKTSVQTVTNLEKLLQSIHSMGATFFKAGYLKLDDDEAKELAAAIYEANKYVDLPLPTDKQLAFINLARVAGTIYAPRIGLALTKKRHGGMSVVPKPVVPATETAQPLTSFLDGIIN